MTYFARAMTLLVALLLTACGPSEPVATETPTLTSTPLATATRTPRPTITPTPTLAPGEIRLGEQITVPGHFSLQVPVGFDHMVDVNGVYITAQSQETVIVFAVFSPDPSGKPGSEIFFELSTEFFEESGISEGSPFTLDGFEGELLQLHATAGEVVAEGVFITIPLANGDEFTAMAISNNLIGEDRWENYGQPAFNAILDTFRFDELIDFGTPCMVSSVSTYGHTPENPIRVGNLTLLDGPERERAFLDALRGPEGQLTSYERVGSLEGEGTILDAYVISIEGSTEVERLYIDMYSWETPQAPVGFTCGSAFYIEAP